MCEVSRRFPTIVAMVIALPLDQVLKLIAIFAAIKDLFYFIFQVIVYLDWIWWCWGLAMDFIAFPGGQPVYIEDWMLAHS
jgi:hypothetical protein